MRLDHWAGGLSSAEARWGKAHVSGSKQFKTLEDAHTVWLLLSLMIHLQQERQMIWGKGLEVGTRKRRTSLLWATNWLLVWVCLSCLQTMDLNFFFLTRVWLLNFSTPTFTHGGSIFLTPFLSVCSLELWCLFIFYFCPFFHSRLLFNLISPANKHGWDWKGEPDSPEKQPCLHTNVPNTNVRYKEMSLPLRFPCWKTGETNKHKHFHLCFRGLE